MLINDFCISGHYSCTLRFINACNGLLLKQVLQQKLASKGHW